MYNENQTTNNPKRKAPCGECDINTKYCMNPEHCEKYLKWRKEYLENVRSHQ